MPTPKHYDLIIIGGGCAGLSLAAKLAAYGDKAPSTLIIEHREQYTNDRTWCFWDLNQAVTKDLIKKSWRQFEIRDGDHREVYSCQHAPYQMLESRDFYQAMLNQIKQNKKIELLMGHPITRNPVKIDQQWHVRPHGAHFTSKWVVDTRPAKQIQDEDAVLWQSFVGVEIQFNTECFDANQLVLMDFDAAFSAGLGFHYVLPISSTQALVEYTVFAPQRMNAETLDPYLQRAIQRYAGKSKYQLLRQEAGILPMGYKPILRHHDKTYVYAGLFAGAARPSSGYAFQRIQSWAHDCASTCIHQLRLSHRPKDHGIQHWMDMLFLQVIKNNQPISASLFASLFRNCSTKTVVKFMSDQANWIDYFKIIISLPPMPFIKALPEYFFGRSK